MIGLSRFAHPYKLKGRRVLTNCGVSAGAPTFETLQLALHPQTKSITVRLKRPTTLRPIAWDITGTIRIRIKTIIDGVLYQCEGQSTGGIRIDHRGREIPEYSLRYVLPWGYFDKTTGAFPTRLGEAASLYYVTIEILQSSGSIQTELDISTTQEAAVGDPYHSSIAFDAASSVQEVGGDGVVSVSHTSTGSNLAVFVGGANSGATPQPSSSTTYGGTGMTEKWDFTANTFYRNFGYTLAGQATGAQTVTNTLAGGPVEHGIGVISMTGVDQTTPVGTAVTGSGPNGIPSITVGSVNSTDFLVDNLYEDSVAGGQRTVGANQTERYDEININSSTNVQGSSQSGADGGVMSWSDDPAASWSLGAIAFLQASAGGRTTKNTRAFPLGVEIGMNWVGPGL